MIDRCDVDFCRHCGLAYDPGEEGWFIDQQDIGPDATGETARLFREDVEGHGNEWLGFEEEDIGPWCDSCSWLLQQRREKVVIGGGMA